LEKGDEPMRIYQSNNMMMGTEMCMCGMCMMQCAQIYGSSPIPRG